MIRIQLRVYIDPGEVEVTVGIRLKDQTFERITAIIDTGASVSLLPKHLLDRADSPANESRTAITVEQAGIARQSFEAVESRVMLILEDQFGGQTQPFEVTSWFADTDMALIGFADVLDRAVLHLDMQQRQGWLDIGV